MISKDYDFNLWTNSDYNEVRLSAYEQYIDKSGLLCSDTHEAYVYRSFTNEELENWSIKDIANLDEWTNADPIGEWDLPKTVANWIESLPVYELEDLRNN